MREYTESLRWLGSDTPYLNSQAIDTCGRVIVGRYGGHSSAGAQKNEDAALVWYDTSGNWEFSVLLDAHNTAQSAALVLEALEEERETLTDILRQPVSYAFSGLHEQIVQLFNSPKFREEAQHIYGETSVLICARKARFLWWMSIGDCLIYLLHPELANVGQYALNQRSFFEWVGRSNTFELPVPCYSSGIRELRGGWNTILMVTDGLLDFGSRPFENPERLYKWFAEKRTLRESIQTVLEQVHIERGRDSATVIGWRCEVDEAVTYPSSILT